MFFKRFGRRHIICGFIYLLWIMLGFIKYGYGYNIFAISALSSYSIRLLYTKPLDTLCYDIILGILGISLTLTAAFEFQHKRVRNIASGALDAHATITYNEMIEHSFYQIINLIQILYFHIIEINYNFNLWQRLFLVFLASSYWYYRDTYPVNKFSDNYIKIDKKSNSFIRIMYRLKKKYQYIFYKHVLLHGFNISIALSYDHIVHNPNFRLYWIFLNTSYVMEFFLQTLVKKRYLNQSVMLILNIFLMFTSSLVAIVMIHHVNLIISCLSLLFNFIHRKKEIMNTFILLMICGIYYSLYVT
jgi:hypothetical protein